jgi:hypothetical protein
VPPKKRSASAGGSAGGAGGAGAGAGAVSAPPAPPCVVAKARSIAAAVSQQSHVRVTPVPQAAVPPQAVKVSVFHPSPYSPLHSFNNMSTGF